MSQDAIDAYVAAAFLSDNWNALVGEQPRLLLSQGSANRLAGHAMTEMIVGRKAFERLREDVLKRLPRHMRLIEGTSREILPEYEHTCEETRGRVRARQWARQLREDMFDVPVGKWSEADNDYVFVPLRDTEHSVGMYEKRNTIEEKLARAKVKAQMALDMETKVREGLSRHGAALALQNDWPQWQLEAQNEDPRALRRAMETFKSQLMGFLSYGGNPMDWGVEAAMQLELRRTCAVESNKLLLRAIKAVQKCPPTDAHRTILAVPDDILT